MSDGLIAPRLQADCPDLALCPAAAADAAFLDRVYLCVRLDELAVTDWDDARKHDFLLSQAALQRAHYERHYPGAEFLVIRRGDQAIGRLFLYRHTGEIRLMDIGLLPEWRGRGIGTRLVASLLRIAGAESCDVTLHVEPDNPARRLYDRFGFRLIEDRGVYLFYGWSADAPAQLNTTS